MKVLEIIAAKHWVNVLDGRTASIYGAAPYHSEMDKANWVIQITGYTWRMDNGTIGCGRIPAKTFNEALEVMNRINGVTK